MQTGYALGEVTDFVDVLDSVNTMLEFQMEQARAARDILTAAAEIENLMGGPWNGRPAIETAAATALPDANEEQAPENSP